jgi:hypothetical protein
LEALAAGGRTTVVFDGIKMGAVVKVNGVVLGNATDQFLRYAWDLHPSTHFLTCGSATNTLEVVFPAQMDVGGRFMACSGGWDWAPYSNTFQSDPKQATAHTFTKGIWKSGKDTKEGMGGGRLWRGGGGVGVCEREKEKSVDMIVRLKGGVLVSLPNPMIHIAGLKRTVLRIVLRTGT